MVVDQVPDRHIESPPQLVAEVLSESTAEKDRKFKFELYQQSKVPTYLIVDPESKTIDLFELATDGYTKQDVTGTLDLVVAGTALTIPLNTIFE